MCTGSVLYPVRRYVLEGLTYARQDARALAAHVECVEDSQALRDLLPGLGLVAFVADGAILPRCACLSLLSRIGYRPRVSRLYAPMRKLRINSKHSVFSRGRDLNLQKRTET